MKRYITCSLAALLLVSFCMTSLGNKKSNKTHQKGSKMVTLPSGLRYETLNAAPAGAKKAEKGRVVSVHYTGWLNDGKDGLGTKFDSSVDRGQMFNFVLGGGQVIRGWDLGVAEMSVGQKIRLYIPSGLGYGAYGAGRLIPPHADLIFDIELFKVQ